MLYYNIHYSSVHCKYTKNVSSVMMKRFLIKKILPKCILMLNGNKFTGEKVLISNPFRVI